VNDDRFQAQFLKRDKVWHGGIALAQGRSTYLYDHDVAFTRTAVTSSCG